MTIKAFITYPMAPSTTLTTTSLTRMATIRLAATMTSTMSTIADPSAKLSQHQCLKLIKHSSNKNFLNRLLKLRKLLLLNILPPRTIINFMIRRITRKLRLKKYTGLSLKP